MSVEKLVFTPVEAAQAAGISRQTLYRWMNMDGFPVARIGGCTRIPVAAFRLWLEQQAGIGPRR